MPKTPTGYYDRFDGDQAYDDAKKWNKVLIKEGRAGQAAEINEIQSIQQSQNKKGFDNIYADGTYTAGGLISVARNDDDDLIVTVGAGRMYALGWFHEIDEDTIEITGIGTEKVYLVIDQDTTTSFIDNNLLDPAQGAENYGFRGGDRGIYLYSLSLTPPGILIATFIDGVLVTPPTNVTTIISDLEDILALRTYEQSGHFTTTPPQLLLDDTTDRRSENPSHIALTIDGGTGYPRGYRRVNTKIFKPIKRTMEGIIRNNEPTTFVTGTKVYSVDNPTVLQINELAATVQSPSFNVTKGADDGADAIPSIYQPVDTIVSVTQAPHGAYTQGVDYQLVGNLIQWLGVEQPLPGSTYAVVVKYIYEMVKGVRTYTSIADEAQTVSGGAFTLAHTDCVDDGTIFVEKSDHSVVYTEGTDYTVNYATGVVTTSIPNTTALLVDYHYWTHTVEGDYVGRDSFVDGAGNVLMYSTPTKTPTGITVDFMRQFSLDVSGSPKVPVNGTNMLMNYKYALARIDVLTWDKFNEFAIVEGTPSVVPKAPAIDGDKLPICKFNIPPEAFYEDVVIERYNNQTLLVTQLRHMLDMISDLQLDVATFQLEQSTLNIRTATDKQGIFAENFKTPDRADLTHADFDGTFDFLAGEFSLPRTDYVAQNLQLNGVDCELKGDMWFPTYDEELLFIQPYRSTARVINKFDNVNTRAQITLNPSIVTDFSQELASVKSTVGVNNLPGKKIKNNLLLSNISPETQVGLKAGQQKKTNGNKKKPWMNVPLEVEWSSTNTDIQNPDLINGTPTASAGTLVQDKWGQVLSDTQVVLEGDIATRTVLVQGKYFLPEERAISLEFNDIACALTAGGIGTQETDPDFPGCVVADVNGEFEAYFEVPAGQKSGEHKIEILGHDPDDMNRVTSYATGIYTATAYVEYMSLYVTATGKVKHGGGGAKQAATVLCTNLGLGKPTKEIIKSIGGPLAYTIAAAVKRAIQLSITLTKPDIAAAVALMLTYTPSAVYWDATKIDNIVDELDLTSTDVISNGNAMIAVEPYAGSSLNDISKKKVDPLAETFTMPEDSFISSIKLFFRVAPGTAPVTVAIAEVIAGVPDDEYLAQTTKDAADITGGGAANVFTFEKPVFLEGGNDYAFVILTEDSAASLDIAVTGGTDPVNGLITKNPFTGVMLESADASTWTPVQSQDIKFEMYRCKFNVTEAAVYISGNPGAFGPAPGSPVSFGSNVSVICMNAQFVEPGENTSITVEYSHDDTTYNEMPPLKEIDLGLMTSSVYMRLVFKCTDYLAPVMCNSAQVIGYAYDTEGAYVHRQYSLRDEDGEYVHLFLDVYEPSGTTVTAFVDFGAGWEEMDDDSEITLAGGWKEHHFIYDTHTDPQQDIRVKVVLETTIDFVSPKIRKFREIFA